MRRLLSVTIVLLVLLLSQPIQAWFGGGHMLIAYIAYKNLTPKTRKRVDALLKLNPLYPTWIKGVSSKQRGQVAFLNAAVWPDCIKQSSCSPGYTSDGGDTPPGKQTDDQNIGYTDKLMHKYWHFIDIPFSEGSPGKPPKLPNALTEIKLMTIAIGSDASDDIKSYDIAWLAHLVGDVHQPLHSTSRFTLNHPDGDAGGNFVAFCAKPCRDELHAYWDGLLGDKLSNSQVTKKGNKILKLGTPAGTANHTPDDWVQDGEKLAETKVYVAPISNDDSPADLISPRPDAAYDTQAAAVAQSQAALAGYRLAALLNDNLK